MERDDKTDEKTSRLDDSIRLKVATPKGVYDANISTSKTVVDLIKNIADSMKLSGGDALELYYEQYKLENERQLSSYDFSDNAILNLVAVGRGVNQK